jgi:hypothetical protein
MQDRYPMYGIPILLPRQPKTVGQQKNILFFPLGYYSGIYIIRIIKLR